MGRPWDDRGTDIWLWTSVAETATGLPVRWARLEAVPASSSESSTGGPGVMDSGLETARASHGCSEY